MPSPLRQSKSPEGAEGTPGPLSGQPGLKHSCTDWRLQSEPHRVCLVTNGPEQAGSVLSARISSTANAAPDVREPLGTISLISSSCRVSTKLLLERPRNQRDCQRRLGRSLGDKGLVRDRNPKVRTRCHKTAQAAPLASLHLQGLRTSPCPWGCACTPMCPLHRWASRGLRGSTHNNQGRRHRLRQQKPPQPPQAALSLARG